MQPKIGIVILNWNDAPSTIKLVDSIRMHSNDYSNFSIYIVDNGSSDNSKELLTEYIQSVDAKLEIELLVNDKNLGYANGNNVGIKKTIDQKSDYTLILNNDVEIVEPIFTELINTFSLNQDIGLVSLKILNSDKTIQKWCARKDTKVVHRFIVYSPLQKLFRETKIYKNYFYDLSTVSDPFEIELFSGAAFIVKTDLIQRVGMFDSNTFLYEEELILKDKLINIGKKIYLNPIVNVIHQDGNTTQKLGVKKYKYMMESERYYLNNYSKEKFIFLKKYTLFIFRSLILILKTMGELLKRGRNDESINIK
jgi:GT2 family glycosyltransferase